MYRRIPNELHYVVLRLVCYRPVLSNPRPAGRMRPADWFHAARQVLPKIVRNNIMCKKSSKRQNLTW